MNAIEETREVLVFCHSREDYISEPPVQDSGTSTSDQVALLHALLFEVVMLM